jgi:hypothetical protein
MDSKFQYAGAWADGLACPATGSISIRFEIGDHVSWNSEAGRVSGTIIAIHTTDFDYKGIRTSSTRAGEAGCRGF